MIENEGVHVLHVSASDCGTPELAWVIWLMVLLDDAELEMGDVRGLDDL